LVFAVERPHGEAEYDYARSLWYFLKKMVFLIFRIFLILFNGIFFKVFQKIKKLQFIFKHKKYSDGK